MKLNEAILLVHENKDKDCAIARPYFPAWISTESKGRILNMEDFLATDWQAKIDGKVIE